MPRASSTASRSRASSLVAVGVRARRRVGLPVAARVVGDDAVPAALERARAHHDVAARRRQPVQQHDGASPRRPPRRPGARRPRSTLRSVIAGVVSLPSVDMIFDVTEPGLRGARSSSARARCRSSSTSGPSGAARAASSTPVLEKAVTAREGKVALAKLDTDANPTHLAGLPDPGDPGRQGVQGRQASSPSSSARSRARRSSASSTRCCPPRPTRSSRAATRRRCARALELEPSRADAPCRSPACCTRAASARRRWRCSSALRATSPADGLGRASSCSRPDAGAGRRVRRARRRRPGARARPADRRAAERRRRARTTIRKVVVGVLDELGVEHPLARDARRKLASALY